MKNPTLYTFFDRLDEYSNFEIKKIIFELTDSLNIELLIELKIELFKYYNKRLNIEFQKNIDIVVVKYKNQNKSNKINEFYKESNNTKFDGKSKYLKYNEIKNSFKEDVFIQGGSFKLIINNKDFSKKENDKNTENLNLDFLKLNLSDSTCSISNIELIEIEDSLKLFLDKLNYKDSKLKDFILSKTPILNSSDIDVLKHTFAFYFELTNYILLVHKQKLDSENEQINITFNELLDLSGETIARKILYLDKLGIINFLRKSQPFNTSINKLATVLSAIIDEDAKSIQPVLNPLISDKEIKNKNHPYYINNNVLKVEQNLINLGFIDFK
jgi:hypothetical protein